MVTTSPEQHALLLIPEVAAELRRSEPSVRWLIATKQLRSGKIAGRVVVKREDLEAFIAAAFEEAG